MFKAGRKVLTASVLGVAMLVTAGAPATVLGAGVVYVGTAQELARIAEQVNAGNTFANTAIELASDIDLSEYPNWVIIGNKPAKPFSGVFDGKGHTISGLSINSTSKEGFGLFGTVANATIRNVDVVGAAVTAGECAGIVVGQIIDNANGQKTVIENVKAEGTVLTNDHDTGLLIGRIRLTKKNSGLLVSGCSAEGTAQSTGGMYIGGLIGHTHFDVSSGGNFLIKDCWTNADVVSKKSYAGGFIGKLDNYEKSSSAVVDNCQAYGSVTSLGQKTGGFVGLVRGFAVKNCCADLSFDFWEKSDDSDPYDFVQEDDDDDDNDSNDDDDDKDDNSVSGQRSNVGGFVGRVKGKSSLKSTFTNCWASCDVIGGRRFVGGFMGRGSYVVVDSCWATGDVQAVKNYVGGFAGRLYKSTVSNSYATGHATSIRSAVGGFVGYATGSTNKFTNCYALGGASSTGNYLNMVGSFGGKIRKSEITNCYSSGLVYGENKTKPYTGAFIGWSGVSTKLSNCYYDSTTTGNLPMVGKQAVKISGSAIGMPTEQMIKASSYASAWKLGSGVWNIIDGETYPFLQYQWDNQWDNGYILQSVKDSTGKSYALPAGDLNDGDILVANFNADRLYFPYGPGKLMLNPGETNAVTLNIVPGQKYAIGGMSQSNIVAFGYSQRVDDRPLQLL